MQDVTKFKPTHIRHLYSIAVSVADTGNSIKVRDLARYVVGAIRAQGRKDARERVVQRRQLRAAGRAHQADLTRERARDRDASYRGQHE